jgi:alkylation response protein AidB-like acyl-CoA dehydrogenase
MSRPTLDEVTNAAIGFLDATVTPKDAERKFVWGEGSDNVAMFEERTRQDEDALIAAARAFRQARFDAGFGWITGPPEYGGRGLGKHFQQAYDAVESRYDVPNQEPYLIGLGMIAPTILAHGSETAKQRYLQSLWRGDIIACQLFSEPAAGSDLASLQTKAERDGDEWVVTGQKVWTSGAQYSDIGEIIARSDSGQPKHKGLTGFIVDMQAPGVDIRPLRQMTGGASFNEVFFNEVRVPDDHRLGDVNAGWTVALTTLMNERAAIGASGMAGGGGATMTRLVEMVRYFGLAGDPLVRQRLAGLITRARVTGYTNQRALAKLNIGQLPGPELSIAKLAATQLLQGIGDFVAHVLGPKLIADSGEWGTYAWSQLVLGTPGMRVAGGTDEVMRNIIGERVLGLPKDPGIDSKTPFRDLRVGTQPSQHW